MKKAQIKIGLRNLNIPGKIQKGHTIVKALEGNVHFPNPKPSVAELKTSISLLEESFQAAADGARSMVLKMHVREKELIERISSLAAHIQNESDGDPEKIISAGFEIRSGGREIGNLEKPLNLRAVTSQRSGEILLDWKILRGANAYIIEQSADGNKDWKICGHSTRRKFSIDGLTSTTNVWFRVSGIGAAGQGPWSDPVKGLIA